MDDIDDALSLAAALGQDGEMPTRLTPDMPPHAAAAHKAVNSTARLLVVRFLLANPGAGRSQIVDGLGIAPTSVNGALKGLEELGYAVRTGTVRSTRWSIDRELLTRDLAEFVAWTLGS